MEGNRVFETTGSFISRQFSKMSDSWVHISWVPLLPLEKKRGGTLVSFFFWLEEQELTLIGIGYWLDPKLWRHLKGL
jgi:hypothetical protein